MYNLWIHIQKNIIEREKNSENYFSLFVWKKKRKILRLNAINNFDVIISSQRKKNIIKKHIGSQYFFAIDEHSIKNVFFLSHIRFVCIDLLHNDNEKESERAS